MSANTYRLILVFYHNFRPNETDGAVFLCLYLHSIRMWLVVRDTFEVPTVWMLIYLTDLAAFENENEKMKH